MKSKYLSGLKVLLYLYLVYHFCLMIGFIAIGYFNYNDMFVGCQEGTCRFGYSFAKEDKSYLTKTIIDGKDYVVKRKINQSDPVASNNTDPKVYAISPTLNTAIVAHGLIILSFIVYIIVSIHNIQRQGIFHESTAQNIQKIVKAFVIIIVMRIIIGWAIDVFTMNTFRLTIDNDTLIPILMIMLLLWLGDIISQGAQIRNENDLTI